MVTRIATALSRPLAALNSSLYAASINPFRQGPTIGELAILTPMVPGGPVPQPWRLSAFVTLPLFWFLGRCPG